MNILNKLTIKSLKMNKKRTLVTIFGIILSAAMICAAGGLVTSAQKTEIESAREDEGDYHVCFRGVEKENLKYIAENRNISNYYFMEGLGYAALPESKNPDKPYLYFLALDDAAFESARLKLMEGRMPENEKEVVLANTVKTNAKVDYQVGDVVSIVVSKRESDGYELTQLNPYINTKEQKEDDVEEIVEKEEEKDITEEETLVEQYKTEVTIVGIIERPNYTIEPYTAPGYSMITRMNKNEISKKADIYVNFEKPKKTVTYAKNIQKTLKEHQSFEQSLEYNYALIRWLGAVSNDTQQFLYAIGAIVIAIIIIASVFVIRNSFAISITERIKQYGMLASIGATSAQIRKNVLFEGFLLGIAAIPIGVLSGNAAVYILIQIINKILKGNMVHSILYSVPVMPMIAAVFLSMITIYFSAFSSARQAAKVAPLEAIRSSRDIKIKAKSIRSPRFIKKYFGMGGEIAYKNLKRSRKKYRATIISMVVSIVLFLSMYSFIEYGFLYSGSYYQRISHNMVVSLYQDTSDLQKTYEKYQEIGKLKGIEAYSIIRRNSSYLINETYLSDLGKEISEKNYIYYNPGEDQAKKESAFHGYIVSLGEKEYKDYLKKIGIKELKENEAILVEIGHHIILDSNKQKKVYGNFYNLKEGDEVIGEGNDGDKISLHIKKITQERPMGLEENRNDEGYFIISDKWMDQITYENFHRMYIKAENPYKLETEIEEIIKKEKFDYYIITNLEETARQENSEALVIEIFLYGFITVITLIGITNIFNTITTNVNLRRREFAMLRSVGMTQKEFSGMIRLESIFYGTKALLFGLPIGSILSFMMYKIFDNNMEMSFQIPWKAYMICIIFVMLIVGLTMYYSFSKIKNENIIETIREDNI